MSRKAAVKSRPRKSTQEAQQSPAESSQRRRSSRLAMRDTPDLPLMEDRPRKRRRLSDDKSRDDSPDTSVELVESPAPEAEETRGGDSRVSRRSAVDEFTALENALTKLEFRAENVSGPDLDLIDPVICGLDGLLLSLELAAQARADPQRVFEVFFGLMNSQLELLRSRWKIAKAPLLLCTIAFIESLIGMFSPGEPMPFTAEDWDLPVPFPPSWRVHVQAARSLGLEIRDQYAYALISNSVADLKPVAELFHLPHRFRQRATSADFPTSADVRVLSCFASVVQYVLLISTRGNTRVEEDPDQVVKDEVRVQVSRAKEAMELEKETWERELRRRAEDLEFRRGQQATEAENAKTRHALQTKEQDLAYKAKLLELQRLELNLCAKERESRRDEEKRAHSLEEREARLIALEEDARERTLNLEQREAEIREMERQLIEQLTELNREEETREEERQAREAIVVLDATLREMNNKDHPRGPQSPLLKRRPSRHNSRSSECDGDESLVLAGPTDMRKNKERRTRWNFDEEQYFVSLVERMGESWVAIEKMYAAPDCPQPPRTQGQLKDKWRTLIRSQRVENVNDRYVLHPANPR